MNSNRLVLDEQIRFNVTVEQWFFSVRLCLQPSVVAFVIFSPFTSSAPHLASERASRKKGEAKGTGKEEATAAAGTPSLRML
jgi:hypothetical protein